MKEQTIFRVVKNAQNPFVMIDKRNLEDPALSWKAKGILAYLLSRPDDWTINVEDIVKHGADGEDAVRSGIDELIEAGHIVRHAERAGGRFFRWVYEVYEKPITKDEPSPFPGFPDVVKPDVENQALNNNDLTNIDDDDSAPKKNIFSLYSENIGPLTPILADQLKEAEKLYPYNWIEAAFKIAVERNARNWRYIAAILDDWQRRGFMAPRPAQQYGKKQSAPLKTGGRIEPTAAEIAEYQRLLASVERQA